MLANTGPQCGDPWRFGDAINLVIVVTIKNEVAFLRCKQGSLKICRGPAVRKKV